MNKSLPERPDLGQLKKQAKDLLNDIRAGRPEAVARVPQNELAGFALADAQRILAREYGFPSWTKLKLHVETRETALAGARLVAAVANGDAAALKTLLAERPQLSRLTVSAVAVLADLNALQDWARQDPSLLRTAGGICQTEALGYVCLGRLGGDEAARVACADFLIGQGANPNATWHDNDYPDSKLPILYAATGRNNYPVLARRLLAAGANPNDGESLYHAAQYNHVECLEVLVAGGGDISRRDARWTNTPLYFLLGATPGDAGTALTRLGILWLLDHGADPNVPSYEKAEMPLHLAIQNGWDLSLIRKFLDCGADANARRADGRDLHSLAVRSGRDDVAALLVERGAAPQSDPEGAFLGAVAKGQLLPARALLEANPGWRESCAASVRRIVLEAAKRGYLPPIEVAGALRLEFTGPDEKGETILHFAAIHGQVPVVKALIALGSPVNQRDHTYHAPPVGWCVHGSLHFRSVNSDYPAVAAELFAAGAETIPIPREEMDPALVAVFDQYAKK
jgi:hypothetical protein